MKVLAGIGAGVTALVLYLMTLAPTVMYYEKRWTDIHLIGYLEDPEPPGIIKAVRALKKGRPYILSSEAQITWYFLDIEGSEKLYHEHGYDLVPSDKDVLLYEVVKSKKPARNGA